MTAKMGSTWPRWRERASSGAGVRAGEATRVGRSAA